MGGGIPLPVGRDLNFPHSYRLFLQMSWIMKYPGNFANFSVISSDKHTLGECWNPMELYFGNTFIDKRIQFRFESIVSGG